MKAIQRHIEEMKKYQEIVNKTNNQYVKNDYSKKIYRMLKELREYCEYRDYDFYKILKNKKNILILKKNKIENQ